MKKPNIFIWRFIWNSELAKQNLGAMAEGNCWIVHMEDKSKRTIFLRPFGFMRGFEDVEKPEPERRPRADQRSVSARSGLKMEVF